MVVFCRIDPMPYTHHLEINLAALPVSELVLLLAPTPPQFPTNPKGRSSIRADHQPIRAYQGLSGPIRAPRAPHVRKPRWHSNISSRDFSSEPGQGLIPRLCFNHLQMSLLTVVDVVVEKNMLLLWMPSCAGWIMLDPCVGEIRISRVLFGNTPCYCANLWHAPWMVYLESIYGYMDYHLATTFVNCVYMCNYTIHVYSLYNRSKKTEFQVSIFDDEASFCARPWDRYKVMPP